MSDTLSGPAAFRAEHQAAVTTLRAALNGTKAAADTKQNAADFLDALGVVLDGAGAANQSALYLLTNAVAGIRLARVQAAAQ